MVRSHVSSEIYMLLQQGVKAERPREVEIRHYQAMIRVGEEKQNKKP